MNEQSNIFTGKVLIVALDGWTDAGSGATGAARYLLEQLVCDNLVSIDDADYFDYLRQRPMIILDEHGDRDFLWPSIELWGPSKETPGNDRVELYFLVGQEPAMQWPYLRDELKNLIEDREINAVIMVGSLAAEAPHNRPIKIHRNSQTAAVRNAYGLEKSNYDGRAGFVSVLGHAFEQAGLPTMSIWAQVPHYVASMPSPKAALALVNELEVLLGISVDHKELLTSAFEWERSVDDFVEGDEGLMDYIRGLEKARDESVAEEMNTDALALEVEKFLRENEEGSEEPN